MVLVVLPGTNILLSVRLLDLVMRSHAAGLIEVVWCDELLQEYREKLVEVRGRTPDSANAAVARFKAAAPDGRISPEVYAGLVTDMVGKDPDDHVLSAAARGGGVDVILAENLADFPDADTGPDCAAMNTGQMFAHLAEKYAEDLAAIVHRASGSLSKPPLSPHEILDRLTDVGLGQMADLVRPHL